jgi:signal transduction histidine kinase
VGEVTAERIETKDTGARSALVVAEQVRALYSRAALPFVTVVVNASVLAYVVWSPGERSAIFGWLGAVYAVTLVRVVAWRAYLRRSPGAGKAKGWGWGFAAGSAANGLAWGASAFALYRPGDVVLQAVILLVLGGMTAGAAASAATFLPAFVAFCVPALLPMTLRLFAEGDKVHVALGAMAALFGVAMTQIARAGGRILIVSEELRIKNAALVDDLRRAREGLTATNEDLERMVTERTSDLVLAHDKLALSERMASMGTLAAGVAHEINNPLAFVLSNLEYVEAALRSSLDERGSGGAGDKAGARLREALNAINDARAGAERVRNIVRDLNTFSRGTSDRVEAIDLVSTLETSIRMAANELTHRARVVREFSAVPQVIGHAGRLAQVFVNLLVNAAQAIPEGSASKNEVRVVARTDAKGRAVIEIRDTGTGIAHDVLPRILDPFFTTKQFGQGTGLGLSICHGIVLAMGGELQVESEVGKGSVFRVFLLPGNAKVASVRPPLEKGPSGRARILVVDDEPMFGKAVERVLGEDHEIIFETIANRALSRLSAGEKFDVIVCDMMMPDCTGMDFYGKASSIDATLAARIVFTTGGAFTGPARDFLDRVSNPRVAKPFTKAEIETALELVLGGQRGGSPI